MEEEPSEDIAVCKEMEQEDPSFPRPPSAPSPPAVASGPGAPLGLIALCAACSRLYPDQPNPLQVTARLKYWLGGPDPLDYISMYYNRGDPDLGVEPHWHYISMGLSDLHGDGRVHPAPAAAGLGGAGRSGAGLELTFRLRAEGAPGAPVLAPPLWPAQMLQALATYVLTTGSVIEAGDHVTRPAWLSETGATGETGARARGKIRHLLCARDHAFPAPLRTPYGHLDVIQVVGCTERELRAAQRRGAAAVLRLLHGRGAATPAAVAAVAAGPLVTDVRRARSAAGLRDLVRAPATSTSTSCDLAGLSTRVYWTPICASTHTDTDPAPDPATHLTEHDKEVCGEGALGARLACEGDGAGALAARASETHMSTDSAGGTRQHGPRHEWAGAEGALDLGSLGAALAGCEAGAGGGGGGAPVYEGEGGGAGQAQYVAVEGAHVVLDAEAAALIPHALTERVLGWRAGGMEGGGGGGGHFSWRGAGVGAAAMCVTLLAPELAPRAPRMRATRTGWLQIVVDEAMGREIVESTRVLCARDDSDSDSDSGGSGGDDSDGAARPPPPPPPLPLPHTFSWPRHRLKLTVLPPLPPLM